MYLLYADWHFKCIAPMKSSTTTIEICIWTLTLWVTCNKSDITVSIIGSNGN